MPTLYLTAVSLPKDSQKSYADIPPANLWAFAQFLKRVQWDHLRECAVDDDEAHEARDGLIKMQELLAGVGYGPR